MWKYRLSVRDKDNRPLERDFVAKEEKRPSDDMFAQCRQADVDLVALGDTLMTRKARLQAQSEGNGAPAAKPTAVQLQPA
jgi:hypothetical protein